MSKNKSMPIGEDKAENLVVIRNKREYPLYLDLSDGTSIHFLPKTDIEVSEDMLEEDCIKLHMQLDNVILTSLK